MNIYLISQNENNGYDTYDSAVVAAKNEEQARNTNPSDFNGTELMNWKDDIYGSWCSKPEKVKVTLLGTAVEGTPWSVLCASFNAG